MVRSGGSDRGKKKQKEHFNPPNKAPPKDPNPNTGLVDTASKLIDEYYFDLDTGNYQDLVFALRVILESFDPKKSVNIAAFYLKVIFSIKKSTVRRLTVYIRKTNVYLVAFFNNKLYEFGNIYDVPKPKQIFYNSTFVGYSESYSGLLSTVTVGYNRLRKAVNTIVDVHENTTHTIRTSWRIHLVVLMVMVCEAIRFHPLFDVFFDLWKDKDDRTLSDGMILFIENWRYISDVANGAKTSIDYQVPETISLDDYDQALGLKDNIIGANRVLAIRLRGRGN
ncbi:GTP-binding nuclear protein Ran-3 [Tanacetum coccineum]